MDTSEIYIKMRRKAIPDLGMGIPIECSLEYPPNSMGRDVWVDRNGNWYYSTVDETFQLERQDQLQEMVDWVSFTVSNRNNQWRMNANHEIYLADSMEQLWLAFVMKEKFGKVWDGENWIK